MKRFISTLLVTTMLVSSGQAWADPIVGPPLPPPVVAPMQKGQTAPFTGVLMSPEAVAHVIAQQNAVVEHEAMAVKHQADLDAIQLKFQVDQLTTTCTADKSILQAQVDDGNKRVQILNDQLKKTTGGPSPSVWMGIGGVGGVVVTLLTVFAVSQATK
jgi:hypothetical protein